ncbi:MAG: type II secretion system protein [Chthoniobacterales bacterium]
MRGSAAFTIIEVLVVLAIILVLAGLVLATSSYVYNKGARSRAEAEIAAISAALENYQADHGIYPVDNSVNARTMGDPTQTAYKSASLTLYKALSGDNDLNRQSDPGSTSYMMFKPNQLSPADQSAQVGYLKDPFGNSYGYSTIYQTDSNKGYNPTFDLWSTAGSVDQESTPASLAWIKNW